MESIAKLDELRGRGLKNRRARAGTRSPVQVPDGWVAAEALPTELPRESEFGRDWPGSAGLKYCDPDMGRIAGAPDDLAAPIAGAKLISSLGTRQGLVGMAGPLLLRYPASLMKREARSEESQGRPLPPLGVGGEGNLPVRRQTGGGQAA